MHGLKGYATRILLFYVNSVLKSLLSTFTHTQNAPVNLRGSYQINFIMGLLWGA